MNVGSDLFILVGSLASLQMFLVAVSRNIAVDLFAEMHNHLLGFLCYSLFTDEWFIAIHYAQETELFVSESIFLFLFDISSETVNKLENRSLVMDMWLSVDLWITGCFQSQKVYIF